MTCPSIDELIAVMLSTQAAGEAEQHVPTCSRCSAELRLLEAVASSLAPSGDVPDALVDRLMAALPALPREVAAVDRVTLTSTHSLVTFFLGTMTAFLGIMVGDAEAGGIVSLVVFSAVVGALAAIVESRAMRPST